MPEQVQQPRPQIDGNVAALILAGASQVEIRANIGRDLAPAEIAAWRKHKGRYKAVRFLRRQRGENGPVSGADRKAASLARRMDIGDIPPPADPTRREACRHDLPLFLRIYMPEVFYRLFDADATALLEDIQTAMLDGGRKAIARPRGSGKTAISLGAALWAALYGHRRYLVIISATGPASLR